MSILKTYKVMIFFEEGEDSVEEFIKARSAKHAEELVFAQNVGVDWVMVDRALTARQYDRMFTTRGPTFMSGRLSRGGQYMYRHKGRKLRNRRNYPERKLGWFKAGPLVFTYTETYSRPFVDSMNDWFNEVITASELPEEPCPCCEESGTSHMEQSCEGTDVLSIRPYSLRENKLMTEETTPVPAPDPDPATPPPEGEDLKTSDKQGKGSSEA